jgi:L-threonylcarbamoyladenylate synthase
MSAGDILSLWSAEVAGGSIRLLDGGTLKASSPSTVVDCTTKRLRVIRPGAIGAALLRESVPDLIGDQ